jgi:hypothetical protein
MSQFKIYWRLNVQSLGGLSNLAYSSNNLKIHLEDWLKLPAYIATSSEGDNPSIHKRIIPIVQSGDLKSIARAVYQTQNIHTIIERHTCRLIPWWCHDNYNPGPVSTRSHEISSFWLLKAKYPGDLKSSIRAGYQTQRCSMMSHIIKTTWPMKSVHTAGLQRHMQ